MEVRPTGALGLQVSLGGSGPGGRIPSQTWDKVFFLPRTWPRGKRGAKQSPRPRGPINYHPGAYRRKSWLREPQGAQASPPRACQNPKIPWRGWARREQNRRNC